MGTNLAPVCDWSTERPFADLFKQSRPWISNTETTWDDGRSINVDERGWVRSLSPGQRARSLVIWGTSAPAGDYVVTWTGSGELDFWPQEAVHAGPGRAIVTVAPARGGIAVTLTHTDPTDPVRNIHVWPAALEGHLFHPAFLESLRPYSVLRFMDWMVTNASTVVSWPERPVVEDARWSVKGVPLEVMMELARATGADPWLSIPHTWNDDTVRRTATLVRERLPSDRRVWIEHSNEVWNDLFPQAAHARQRGTERGRSRNPFEAQLRDHAARSVEIFAPFEAAFSSDPRRIVRVLGGMAATPWTSATMLADPGVAAHVDAVAIAPYFGGSLGDADHAAQTRRMSLDALFRAVDGNVQDTLALVRAHRRIAAAHGISLVAYEGGQHLTGAKDEEDILYALFLSANRDSRMKAAYLRFLDGWRDAGGALFVHYLDIAAPSKHGAWGARENLLQTRKEAPKWDALLQFVETTPVWWER